MAAVSGGTSHATTKWRFRYITSVDVKEEEEDEEEEEEEAIKRIQSLIENHMWHERSKSAREQTTALYNSDQKGNNNNSKWQVWNNNNNSKWQVCLLFFSVVTASERIAALTTCRAKISYLLSFSP